MPDNLKDLETSLLQSIECFHNINLTYYILSKWHIDYPNFNTIKLQEQDSSLVITPYMIILKILMNKRFLN